MPASIKPAKAVYVDTNEFVYARASQFFPRKHRNLPYYKAGRECIAVLKACRKERIVVYSSMIAHIELYALHLDWTKRNKLVELQLPLAFAFGEGHRNEDMDFIRNLFTAADRPRIYEELENWLRTWNFVNLIRWVLPSDIPHWRELTEVALWYMPRRHIADALHIGAAIGLECNTFFSHDSQLRAIISSMRNDAGLRRELEKHRYIRSGFGLPNPITGENGLT